MPLYDNDGKFIHRVYKDGDLIRRVYENAYDKDPGQKVSESDEGLVYSLYDINYNYGQEGSPDPSGAYMEGTIFSEDVWGLTHDLSDAKYIDLVDIETDATDEITYNEWHLGIHNGNNSAIDDGFVISNSISETDIENYEDYNLYIDLVRTAKTPTVRNYRLETTGIGTTIEEAKQNAEIAAYEAGATHILNTVINFSGKDNE